MSLLHQLLGTSSYTCVRALVIFILVWSLLVYVFFAKFDNEEEHDATSKRVNRALQLLSVLHQRNQDLEPIIDALLDGQLDHKSALKIIQKFEYNIENSAYGSASDEPSLEYELTRRRIQSNIDEIWNYFSNELRKIRKKVGQEPNGTMLDEINQVLMLGAEHKRSLLSDMERLRHVDGHETWRYKEAKHLSDLVQKRLTHLQNPTNCTKAKKLVCNLNKDCGYGCQLHHVVYCFIVAYATERTLILKSKGWSYHKNGWEDVFMPVSEACFDFDSEQARDWPGQPETHVLKLPVVEYLMDSPSYLPLAIPEDLAPRLKRLHGDPFVWWAGQVLKYLLKPQNATQKFLSSRMSKLGWKRPIVGVHVRRTDKLYIEAAFHSIDEYMTHVEDYFLTQEINGTTVPRRIFLASDDARVLKKARKKYPQYEIIGDAEVARMAAVSTRYTDTALNDIILDIHLLSLSDYLVCTFSSQVCRVAYEIMQSLNPDAAHRFKSLDDIYYYGGQNPYNRQAVMPHKASNHDEVNLKPGDLIGVAGNNWNGYSEGTNRRTNQAGLFPSFKVVDKVETAKFPT